MTLALFAFGAYLGACGQIPVEVRVINTPKTESTSSASPTYTPPAISSNYCDWSVVNGDGFGGNITYACTSTELNDTAYIQINNTKDIYITDFNQISGGNAFQGVTFNYTQCIAQGVSGNGPQSSYNYNEVELDGGNWLIGFKDKNGYQFTCTH